MIERSIPPFSPVRPRQEAGNTEQNHHPEQNLNENSWSRSCQRIQMPYDLRRVAVCRSAEEVENRLEISPVHMPLPLQYKRDDELWHSMNASRFEPGGRGWWCSPLTHQRLGEPRGKTRRKGWESGRAIRIPSALPGVGRGGIS